MRDLNFTEFMICMSTLIDRKKLNDRSKPHFIGLRSHNVTGK